VPAPDDNDDDGGGNKGNKEGNKGVYTGNQFAPALRVKVYMM